MTESHDAGSEFFETCAACGTPLTDGQWHPVVTETTDDGVDLHSFCDGDCRSQWSADD